jgi:hypothetical protein
VQFNLISQANNGKKKFIFIAFGNNFSDFLFIFSTLALSLNGYQLEGTVRPLMVKYAEDQHKKKSTFFTGNAATQPAPKAKTFFSIPVVKSGTSSSSVRVYHPDEAIDELDQPDLVDTEGGEGSRVSCYSLVCWSAKRFRSLDPRTVPFEPKTVAMRKILNNQPILASPVNPVAMEEEERTALFLLQMPSDLR